MKKILVASLVIPWALCCLLISSCDAVRMPPPAAGSAPEKAAATPKKAPRHPLDGRRVAVYAGPRYASKAMFEALELEYGLVDEGGMLFYPAKVSDAGAQSGLTAIITLGAPERTVRSLESLRSGQPGLSIISVFPADEVLAVEAVSDLVIDMPSASNLLADENDTESVFISDSDLSFLLLAAALFAEQNPDTAPLARFDAALQAARKEIRNPIAGKDWNVAQYLDTDTGLKARNHLIIDISGGTEP